MSIQAIFEDKTNNAFNDYLIVKSFIDRKQIDQVSFKNAPGLMSNLSESGNENDHICAKALIAMAVLNGPTDIEEFVGAAKQIREMFGGKKADDYNHRIAQHPFSFFRGTVLHNYLNPNSEKCISKNLAKKIIKADKSIFETKFGKWIRKKLGIEIKRSIPTKVESIEHTEKHPRYVQAFVLKSPNEIADLTGRAMLRTTKFGTIVLGTLGAIHAGYRIKEGKDVKESLTKAAVEVGTSVVAVGYLGALGCKYGRTLGSLTGVIAGTAIGAAAPKVVDKLRKE